MIKGGLGVSGMFPADLNRLQSFMEWRGGIESPWDEEIYLHKEVPLAGALVFSRYLFPKIIKFSDGYFIEDMFDGLLVESAVREARLSLSDIEASFNFFNLENMIGKEVGGDEVDELARILAQVIAFGWRAAAEAQFPGVPFITEISGDIGMIVTMHVDHGNV